MREKERLTGQLRRAVEGEAWHGPSVMEILEDVDAAAAAAHPLPDAHSIWDASAAHDGVVNGGAVAA